MMLNDLSFVSFFLGKKIQNQTSKPNPINLTFLAVYLFSEITYCPYNAQKSVKISTANTVGVKAW